MKKAGLVLILFLLIILTGCSITEKFGFGKSVSTGRGVITKFIDAPPNNAKINEGDPFGFQIEISNYVTGETGVSGEICMEDDLSENYGGIPSNACQSVDLPPATNINNRVTPTLDIFSFGTYEYRNLESSLSLGTGTRAKLNYEVSTTAGAVTCVRSKSAKIQGCGETKTLSVQQPDMPLKISTLVSKSIPLSDQEADVQLEITLSKSINGQLFTKGRDSNRQTGSAEIDFDVTVDQLPATCLLVSNNRVVIRQNEDQKVIKCHSRVSLNSDSINAPIIIKIGYGFIQTIQGPTLELRKEEAIA